MNVACDYEAPMQMLTTEKYIAGGSPTREGPGYATVYAIWSLERTQTLLELSLKTRSKTNKV